MFVPPRDNRGHRFAVAHALGHHEMDLVIGLVAQIVLRALKQPV